MSDITQERRHRLCKGLTGEGIDTAILVHPLSIFYLSGVLIRPYERFLGLVLHAASGDATLIVPGVDHGVQPTAGIRKKVYSDADDPLADLAEAAGSADVVGLEKAHLPLFRAERMQAWLGERWEDVSPLIDRLRLTKDAHECARHREAAVLADGVMAAARAALQPGRTEKQVVFDILQAMSRHTGVLLEDPVVQVLSGLNSVNPHGAPGDKAIEKGDPVTIDFGLNYRHYWADITRTFFVGRPDQRLQEIYHVVREAQAAAIDTVEPGVPMARVDRAAREVIERAGYGAFFVHRTGHGLGIDVHEAPSVHGRNDRPLEPGMVITIEPGIYVPGRGGIRIEDDVIVTATAREVITAHPKDFGSMVVAL